MKAKISLYECQNAKIRIDERRMARYKSQIYCSKGHSFGKSTGGTVSMQRLMRGEPLVYEVCQKCKDIDYDPMEYPEDRGWIK